MSTTNKKLQTLSCSSLTKLVSKHSTCVQSAENTEVLVGILLKVILSLTQYLTNTMCY